MSEINITRENGEFLLRTSLLVTEKIEVVFGFFSNAENLQQLTPEHLDFKITSPLPIEMKNGTIIDYQLKLHGIRFNWQTLIPEWNPPKSFIDSQKRGPYKYWIHHHEFEANGDNTLIKDSVRYQVPGGRLIHSCFVKRDLVKIFEYRRQVMLNLFGQVV